MVPTAAIIFATLSAIVALFQLALAAGAPWGHLAMGGRFPGRLPPAMRVVAIVQLALFVVLALIILSRAQIVLADWYASARPLSWAIVALMTLSFIMNLATPSKAERRLWAPVAGIMLLAAIIVALGP